MFLSVRSVMRVNETVLYAYIPSQSERVLPLTPSLIASTNARRITPTGRMRSLATAGASHPSSTSILSLAMTCPTAPSYRCLNPRVAEFSWYISYNWHLHSFHSNFTVERIHAEIYFFPLFTVKTNLKQSTNLPLKSIKFKKIEC